MSTAVATTPELRLPRLRDDLEIVRQETADGAAYLIRDPRSGRFCRFREAEHLIATQCDGRRTLADIRNRVADELQVDLPTESIEKFLQRLGELGLLESDGDEAAQSPGRIIGGALHRRLRLFDPDRLLGRLVGPLAFIFTGPFLVFSALAMFVAGVVALDNAAELGAGLSRVAQPHMLPAIVLAIVAVTLLHELAHGLTCKHFGGPVHDIGFLLIYFLPAFYCDVSSAWAFTEKSKRLWVTFAGVWCNLITWTAALFCWRVTQSDTWIHTASLLVLAVSGVDTFFNLIPLIKLDGYYLLSDALDAPNLRQNSFAWLGGRVKQFCGGDAEDRPEPVQRLKSIYCVYGVAATMFSTTLLITVAFRLGGFLMEQFQALGFLTFAGMLVLVVARPLGRLVRRHPSEDALHRSPRRRIAWPIRMALFVGVPVLGVMLSPWQLSVVGNVDVQAKRKAEIRAQTDGLIEAVDTCEGDAVSCGSVIVRLANPERRSEVAQVEADIRKKTAELALLRSGAKPEEIALAKAAVETAQTRIEHARKRRDEAVKMRGERLQVARAVVRESQTTMQFATEDLERHRALSRQSAVTAAQLELKQSAVATAQAALDAARARERLVQADDLAALAEQVATAQKQQQEAESALQLLQSGPRETEVAAAQAELDRLIARQRYLQEQQEREALQSPIAGVVTTPHMDELLHRRIEAGELVAEVQELNSVRVELSVSEKELGDVREGQQVDLKVVAYPDLCFHGRVVGIAPAAVSEPHDTHSSRDFIVTTLIDNESQLLRPGMTGKAKIRCGQSRVGQVICRKLSHYVRVEFWSWW